MPRVGGRVGRSASRRGVCGSLLVALEFVVGRASEDTTVTPMPKAPGQRPKQYNKLRRKRERGGKPGESPQLEVTGQHVIIFVALVFAAAWAAGLLPDP